MYLIILLLSIFYSVKSYASELHAHQSIEALIAQFPISYDVEKQVISKIKEELEEIVENYRSDSFNDVKEHQCSICLKYLTDFIDLPEETILTKLQCRHIFCNTCIDEWRSKNANATCPLCQKSIIKSLAFSADKFRNFNLKMDKNYLKNYRKHRTRKWIISYDKEIAHMHTKEEVEKVLNESDSIKEFYLEKINQNWQQQTSLAALNGTPISSTKSLVAKFTTYYLINIYLSQEAASAQAQKIARSFTESGFQNTQLGQIKIFQASNFAAQSASKRAEASQWSAAKKLFARFILSEDIDYERNTLARLLATTKEMIETKMEDFVWSDNIMESTRTSLRQLNNSRPEWVGEEVYDLSEIFILRTLAARGPLRLLINEAFTQILETLSEEEASTAAEEIKLVCARQQGTKNSFFVALRNFLSE